MSKLWTKLNFICALSSHPRAIASRPYGHKMARKDRNINFKNLLRMCQIMHISKKNFKNFLGRRHFPTPHPNPKTPRARHPQLIYPSMRVIIIKTPRLWDCWADVNETWRVYSVGLGTETSRKRNFEFRPVHCAGGGLQSAQSGDVTHREWQLM